MTPGWIQTLNPFIEISMSAFGAPDGFYGDEAV